MVCLGYLDVVLGLLYRDAGPFFPRTPSPILRREMQKELVLFQSLQCTLWAAQLREEAPSLQGSCSLAFLLAVCGLKGADADTHVL